MSHRNFVEDVIHINEITLNNKNCSFSKIIVIEGASYIKIDSFSAACFCLCM